MSQKNKVSQEGPDEANNLFYRKSDLTRFLWKEIFKSGLFSEGEGVFWSRNTE